MEYVIQENIFKEHHYAKLHDALDRLNLRYSTIKIFPYVNKIVDVEFVPTTAFNVDDLPDFETATSNVFVFGAIKLAQIALEKSWLPGSLMNENHDFLKYAPFYKENLLNYDSEIQTVGANLKWKKDELKFIRPTLDTKAFTGQVFSENEWKEKMENYLHNFRSPFFNEDTEIQTSVPKRIFKEIRFWVVDGIVVTGSQYKLGNNVIYDSVYEKEAEDFAQSMVNLFQLADAFVIDVCLTDTGWKIVECGCINCAGFYKSDLQKTIHALEMKFNDVVYWELNYTSCESNSRKLIIKAPLNWGEFEVLQRIPMGGIGDDVAEIVSINQTNNNEYFWDFTN